MIALARGAVLLAWLGLSLYLFAFLIGGLLIGSAMAGSIVAGVIGLFVISAISFGWWKLTCLIAVGLGLRDPS